MSAAADPAPQRDPLTRTDTAPPVRLAKGAIPQTWSRPAEQVSQVPIRAPRPLASAFIVVGGSVAGFCLALWLAPSRGAGPTPPPTTPPPTAAASAVLARGAPATAPADAVPPGPAAAPPPAPTSAPSPAPRTAPPTAPPPAAPPAPVPMAEPAPVAAIPTPPATSSTSPGEVAPEDQGGDAEETPARRKARKETERAKALYASGEMIGAEPPLIRATLGDPTFPDAWRLLGQVRDGLGNVEGARRAYKHFLQLAPTTPEARQVRAALAALPPAGSTPPPAAPPTGN
ncbi:MAG: hypothetical protein IT382_01700 [Deltaproteobacteria bacterium]|nr:hypothetical protein [Deltaproteobacteria bacterium]